MLLTKRNVYCVSRATSSSGSPRTVARQSPSCAERKNASGHFCQRPKGRLRRFGGALRRPFGLAPVIIRDVEYSG